MGCNTANDGHKFAHAHSPTILIFELPAPPPQHCCHTYARGAFFVRPRVCVSWSFYASFRSPCFHPTVRLAAQAAMEAKLEGRSSRKLYSVDHNRNSTLPGSSHFIRHNNSFTTISAPRLVDRWQFRSAKSASPENGMSEGGDGNSESFSLVGSLYQRVSTDHVHITYWN